MTQRERSRSWFTGHNIDLFDGDRDAVIAMAQTLWEMREGMFPERVRRMKPDAIDMATGSWEICVKEAIHQIVARNANR